MCKCVIVCHDIYKTCCGYNDYVIYFTLLTNSKVKLQRMLKFLKYVISNVQTFSTCQDITKHLVVADSQELQTMQWPYLIATSCTSKVVMVLVN